MISHLYKIIIVLLCCIGCSSKSDKPHKLSGAEIDSAWGDVYIGMTFQEVKQTIGLPTKTIRSTLTSSRGNRSFLQYAWRGEKIGHCVQLDFNNQVVDTEDIALYVLDRSP